MKFQLENGREAGARKDIEYVLRYNKVSEIDKTSVLDKVDRLIEKNQKMRERQAMLNKGQEPVEQGVFSRLVKDGNAFFNICMMVMVWVASSLTFYIFNFLIKYMPGDIYFNSIVSGFSAAALIF